MRNQVDSVSGKSSGGGLRVKIVAPLAMAGLGLFLLGTGTAKADVFDVCPSGHEGVVGGHTSCPFAYNVGRAFDACGMCSNFVAFSPVTGERYEIVCAGLYPAHFTNGQVLTATHG